MSSANYSLNGESSGRVSRSRDDADDDEELILIEPKRGNIVVNLESSQSMSMTDRDLQVNDRRRAVSFQEIVEDGESGGGARHEGDQNGLDSTARRQQSRSRLYSGPRFRVNSNATAAGGGLSSDPSDGARRSRNGSVADESKNSAQHLKTNGAPKPMPHLPTSIGAGTGSQSHRRRHYGHRHHGSHTNRSETAIPLAVLRSCTAKMFEPCRFTVPDELLDEVVTKECLQLIAAHHVECVGANKKSRSWSTSSKLFEHDSQHKLGSTMGSTQGEVSLLAELQPCFSTRAEGPSASGAPEGATNLKVARSRLNSEKGVLPLLEDIDTLWNYAQPGDFDNWTVRDMLGYDLPDYAVTSKNQREILKGLSERRQTIYVEELQQLLDLSDDDPLLSTIFGAQNCISGVTLQELVAAMELQPNRPKFITHCAHRVTGIQRNIALFFPSLIAFVIAAVFLIVNFAQNSPFPASFNLLFPMTDDWRNSCPNSTTDPCLFVTKNLATVNNLVDARHFFSVQLIEELWGWKTNHGSLRASDTKWGGVWLIGALLLQSSPILNFQLRPGNPPLLSRTLFNLTGNFEEPLVPQTFSGDAWSFCMIPFTDTQDEALAKANDFKLIRVDNDTVWMAQFGAMSPTTGTLLWTTVTVMVPMGGDAITRAHTVPIDLDMHNKIFVLLLVQVSLFVIHLIILGYNTYLSHKGFLFILTHRSVLIEIPLLGILAAAYYQFSSLVQFHDFFQVDHVPLGFDGLADQYRQGVVYLGLWIMLWTIATLRFLKDINGVGIIIRLLRVVALEFIGLFCVFGIIYAGFLAAALVLFGATQQQFSSAMHANAELLPFWWEEEGRIYNVLSEERPIEGGTFYFIYKVFVFFFALDLLIAVVTSPLHKVKKAANLHTQLVDSVTRLLAKKSWKRRVGFFIRKHSLSLVAFITDAIVVLPATNIWIRFQYVANKVYDYHPNPKLESRAKHCLGMLKFVYDTRDPSRCGCVPWNSVLWRGCEQQHFFKDPIAKEVLKACIMRSTNNSVVRDARLMQVLLAYGRYQADLDCVLTAMKRLRREKEEKEYEVEEELLATLERERRQEQEGQNNLAKSSSFSSSGKPTLSIVSSTTGTYGNDEAEDSLLDAEESRGKLLSLADVELSARNAERGLKIDEFLKNNNQQRDELGGNKKRVSQLTFAFSQFFMRRVEAQRYFPCVLIFSATAYTILLAMLLVSHQDVAWVVANAEGALVKEPYVTQCTDLNCSEGFTRTRSFRQQGHLRDFYEYINRSFAPNLFPSRSYMSESWGALYKRSGGISNAWSDFLVNCSSDGRVEKFFGSSTSATAPSPPSGTTESSASCAGEPWYPVYWDLNLVRNGPIRIRQLRASSISCVYPRDPNTLSLSPTGELRKMAVTSVPCFGTGVDDMPQAPFPRPQDSLFPESAYVYTKDTNSSLMRGWFYNFPPTGYMVEVWTQDELKYLEKWIDNTTRFIAITLDLSVYGSPWLSTKFELYWELAHEGGAAWVWTRAYPKGEQKLRKWNPAAYSLMALEVLLYLFSWCRYIYFRQKGNLIKAEHTRPDLPLSVCWSLILMLGSYLFAANDFERETFFTLTCIIFLTAKFLFSVAFPLADLATRGASLIKNILWLTLSNVAIIVPFYFVVFTALVLSGNVMFSERMLRFANLKTATITVARGLVGDWEFEEFGDFNSTRAGLTFNCAFVVLVLILLANIVLSLIHGSAEEAREEEEALDFIAETSAALNRHTISGPLFQFLLCHVSRKSWLFCFFPEAWLQPAKQPFTITAKGRFPLPWEILYRMPDFGSRLHAELVEMLDAYELPNFLAQSTVMLIAKEMREFQRRFPDRSIDDEAIEFQLRLADERIANAAFDQEGEPEQ